MNHAQVLQLNAALRDTIEFRSYDRDERGNPILPIAAGAAGLGGSAPDFKDSSTPQVRDSVRLVRTSMLGARQQPTSSGQKLPQQEPQ